jgi:hypothetical protein
VWDAAGAPLAVAELPVELITTRGRHVKLVATRTELAGRYRLALRLRRAGDHALVVAPPGGDARFELPLPVVAAP